MAKSQPRAPKGSSNGGQWVGGNSRSGTGSKRSGLQAKMAGAVIKRLNSNVVAQEKHANRIALMSAQDLRTADFSPTGSIRRMSTGLAQRVSVNMAAATERGLKSYTKPQRQVGGSYKATTTGLPSANKQKTARSKKSFVAQPKSRKTAAKIGTTKSVLDSLSAKKMAKWNSMDRADAAAAAKKNWK